MIANFVTPHEDELWYSVLSRYHRDSGNDSVQMTERELFGSSKQKIATVMPNIAMIRLLNRLPENLFSFEKLVKEHTLFHFYRRFETEERKRLILSEIRDGKFQKNILYQYQMKTLNYCPFCLKEDERKYGESYWHTSHQMPGLRLCPKHFCQLERIIFENEWDINEHFYLPEHFTSQIKENTMAEESEIEKRLTRKLDSIRKEEIEVSIRGEHNNLIQDLCNQGYSSARREGFVNCELLEKDLISFYGKNRFTEIFGEKLELYLFARLKKWKWKNPLPIAGLLAFLNLPLQEALSDNVIEPKLKEKLEEGLEKGIKTRKEMAEFLKVSPSSVTTLARRYGITPIWREKEKRTHEVKLFFSDEEWKRVCAVSESREELPSRVLRDLIISSIKTVENIHEQ